MKYLKTLFVLALFGNLAVYGADQTSFTIVSPDGKLSAKIELKDKNLLFTCIG